MKNNGMMNPPRHSDESVTDVPASFAHAASAKNATVPPCLAQDLVDLRLTEGQRVRRHEPERREEQTTDDRTQLGSQPPRRPPQAGAEVGERHRDERAAEPGDERPRQVAEPDRGGRREVPDRRRGPRRLPAT